MEKPDDFEALGREHGHELARLRTKMLASGYDDRAWETWLVHRMRALADDLRSVGSTEEQVQAWAVACLASYEGRAAVAAEAQAYSSLLRMPAQGRA